MEFVVIAILSISTVAGLIGAFVLRGSFEIYNKMVGDGKASSAPADDEVSSGLKQSVDLELPPDLTEEKSGTDSQDPFAINTTPTSRPVSRVKRRGPLPIPSVAEAFIAYSLTTFFMLISWAMGLRIGALLLFVISHCIIIQWMNSLFFEQALKVAAISASISLVTLLAISGLAMLVL